MSLPSAGAPAAARKGLPNVEIGMKTKRVPKTALARFLEPKAG